MLTLFTTAKPFLGHSAVIQRNALQSWTLLHPDIEIILFGDDEGAAEICAELGLRHEPCVLRNPAGLKRIDDYFDRAQRLARHPILCYANCDILFTADFLPAIRSSWLAAAGMWTSLPRSTSPIPPGPRKSAALPRSPTTAANPAGSTISCSLAASSSAISRRSSLAASPGIISSSGGPPISAPRSSMLPAASSPSTRITITVITPAANGASGRTSTRRKTFATPAEHST